VANDVDHTHTQYQAVTNQPESGRWQVSAGKQPIEKQVGVKIVEIERQLEFAGQQLPGDFALLAFAHSQASARGQLGQIAHDLRQLSDIAAGQLALVPLDAGLPIGRRGGGLFGERSQRTPEWPCTGRPADACSLRFVRWNHQRHRTVFDVDREVVALHAQRCAAPSANDDADTPAAPEDRLADDPAICLCAASPIVAKVSGRDRVGGPVDRLLRCLVLDASDSMRTAFVPRGKDFHYF
jgi:hypothetical protein